MSEQALIQQLLRYSNYYGTGFPYYTDVYVPVIKTITNNANIVLKQSTDNFYTVRSTSGNSTINSLVIGDATDGTFTETSLTGDAITIAGTVTSNYYNYCQVKWWNTTNLAIFTVDQGSPYALKVYTVNISTGVTSLISTLVATIATNSLGVIAEVNSTYIYVITDDNIISKYTRAGVLVESLTLPLFDIHSSLTYRNFNFYNNVALTNSYLYVYSYAKKLFLSSLTNIQKQICIGSNLESVDVLSAGDLFEYGVDYDRISTYLQGYHSGLVYISDTSNDFIKFGVL